MLQKTRGIVISYIRYQETSIIVKIYTEELGIQTYIENGVRSSKSKNKIALFQPLTLVELVVYHEHNRDIGRISEIKCAAPFQTLPYQFDKTSIAIFITETLSKTLKEETANHALFRFLMYSITFLDVQESQYENFPIQFLLKFARYLGFAPQHGREVFEQTGSLRLSDVRVTDYEGLDLLIRYEYHEHVAIDYATRRYLLETVLKFYALHVENFGELRSLPVLKEIMS